MESLITAVISGSITAAASIVAAFLMHDKTVAVLNERMESQARQIARLEEKQDKSNQVKERVAILERDVQTAFMRIDEMKKGA